VFTRRRMRVYKCLSLAHEFMGREGEGEGGGFVFTRRRMRVCLLGTSGAWTQSSGQLVLTAAGLGTVSGTECVVNRGCQRGFDCVCGDDQVPLSGP
jgi:hypothetical protein